MGTTFPLDGETYVSADKDARKRVAVGEGRVVYGPDTDSLDNELVTGQTLVIDKPVYLQGRANVVVQETDAKPTRRKPRKAKRSSES